MYSRGSNAYGQQPYAGQSGYGQNLRASYSGSSVGGTDGRHSSMIGGAQESDIPGYRGHGSATAHYGGQYSSVYGSAAISAAQQASTMGSKASASVLEGRGSYSSALPDSPKFSSIDYVSSSSHGYSRKSDQLYADKIVDYPTLDRRQYSERSSAYLGREMQADPAARYVDSVGFSQPEIYERIDQASMLRQEQLLKSQSLQSASLEGGARQLDYLAARGVSSRHSTQDLMSYGGRMEAEARGSSLLSASYSGQHPPSILGAAPRRNMDDLLYSQSSTNPGYGVSLPPGRDYGTGKQLHPTSLELDYLGGRGIDELRDERASYLREFERREEERRREQLLRDREKERERDREREREREQERERERERKRERERLERREKEKEREHKRLLETRHERTPVRLSKDRRGSSLTKDGRSLRRDSTSHEASHRHHSPVKEKRREYVCKVHTSSLVEVERDYLSIDKRYPRLFVSAEFSKVVVNWPRDNLKLSIHTPVSFDHYFVDDEGIDLKDPSHEQLPQVLNPVQGSTIWNAKLVLLSGLSRNALEELSSEKSSSDYTPHICNILRFALLKKDHSFMAIGGPWCPSDGGDPSTDEFALIQTARRYAKYVTQLDLQNCRNWNRFLEIHYDRIGKNGFFSHKEVTVLYVPDLSDCLPSLDTWREQWLAHKKAVADREHELSLKKERYREKQGQKDKGTDSTKDSKTEKIKESATSVADKKEKEGSNTKDKLDELKDDGNDNKLEKKDGNEMGEGTKNPEEKEQAESVGTTAVESLKSGTVGIVKSGKKKIIRRIVKQKVAAKKSVTGNTAGTQNESVDGKVIGENNGGSEISAEQSEPAADPSGGKTFEGKKVVKNVSEGKTNQNEDNSLQSEVKAENQMDSIEDKAKDPGGAVVVQGSGVKTAIKKKIIKRVLKRKLTGASAGNGTGGMKKDDEKLLPANNETESVVKQTTDADQISEQKSPEKKTISKANSTLNAEPHKQAGVSNSNKKESKTDKEDNKDEAANKKSGSATEIGPQKDDPNGKRGKSKNDKKSKDEEKGKDEKDESRSKSNNKEGKEKRKPEEPPKHPGLILQTKGDKDTKVRSLSLSMDWLLNYTDKDIEESTFELSLFAESLYEMLQYEMGCRLLNFLQKLRIKFIMKRNQRKRRQEEINENKGKNLSSKRLKTDELPVKPKSAESVLLSADRQPDDQNTEMCDGTDAVGVNETKLEQETDEEEDPEEDPEEYEGSEDPGSDMSREEQNNKEDGTKNAEAEIEPVTGNDEMEVVEEAGKEKSRTEGGERKPKSDTGVSENRDSQVKTVKKDHSEKESALDKELLQAFRFFDRNQTGHIRVEDMRLILHSLGKFLSHRDVKELVQSALLESNTGRDDRILYRKLVRMTDI